ncbi:hypothetical protein JQ634_07020 [Bradyrhizobium sp. AUGA SZCCT0240]|uniref:hypothetical protein n=1 Tax=unclassified Bradyrhizobium TaxID=2631580 RepID=UPI001BAE440D|nr:MULTISPECIES: hypothetical protein [unclassified Bradyrhizobium]MBR1194518.1 hypothetical protein [Bradyrhizobium sp. AUGA SZCCT0158]MBR1241255.1 hypothetical protein [Bradyrhizobium sp. AUGA SZCCT0274]MBR1249933.1 hypothetical protein [Bradyrhizobium sp. AUGA SZCCT0169]MBR1253452.1 hypothetical protein [Bradyrhizobium sp. AUGA SZCCT0240]
MSVSIAPQSICRRRGLAPAVVDRFLAPSIRKNAQKAGSALFPVFRAKSNAAVTPG